MSTSVPHLTTFPCRRWQRHQSPTWFSLTSKRASVSVPTAFTATSTAISAVPSQSTVGLLLVQSDNRECPVKQRVVQLLPAAFTAAPGLHQDKSHQNKILLFAIVILSTSGSLPYDQQASLWGPEYVKSIHFLHMSQDNMTQLELIWCYTSLHSLAFRFPLDFGNLLQVSIPFSHKSSISEIQH